MKAWFCFTLALYGCLCLLTLAAEARVIYVSPTGDDGNNGLTWATAKRTVQAGIASAVSGDEVWTRHGVYMERITLKSGVKVYGGFRGTETSLSQRPAFPRSQPDQYESVIDGNQEGSVVSTPASATREYRVDGFTIRNGRATNGAGFYCEGAVGDLLIVANCTVAGNTATANGGGIYCTSSSPTLVNCTITGNNASYGGGLFGSNNSSPTLNNCAIRGNSAANTGGGMDCTSSSPTLANCTITGNSAGYGGGIHCYSNSSPALRDCTITSNRAANSGGGLRCYKNSAPTLTNCTISHNTADNAGGVICYDASSPVFTTCLITSNSATSNGGGVYCTTNAHANLAGCRIAGNSANNAGGVYSYNSSPSLTSCVITDNAARNNGAGLWFQGGSATLSNCTITANKAVNSGGGVYFYSGSAALNNCHVSGNVSNYGGGLCFAGGTVQLNTCFISRNKADTGGGGLYCSNASPTLTGCTITENSSSAGGAVWSKGSETIVNTLVAYNLRGIFHSGGTAPSSFRYNCVWGNSGYNYSGMTDPTGTNGNISVDPLLVAGHLLPGSPCIDAGNNSLVTTSQDIDAEPRIDGTSVDIGADEFCSPIVQGLLGFVDYAGEVSLLVQFGIHGTTETRTTPLDADGFFVVTAVPVGQFALSVKPLSYLRKIVEVDTLHGSMLDVYIELVNGDIDGDNEVTLFDFGRLVGAFGSLPGDTNWDASADLDGDGEVTLFDFGIVVRNFGEIGDE